MKSDNKRVRIFLGASIGALVVILAVPSQKEEGASDGTADTLAAATFELNPTSDANELAEKLSKQAERAKRLQWGRDPFRNSATWNPTGQNSNTLLQLTGFAVVKEQPLAIIGHDIVGPGDRLATGHTVVAIGDGTVTLDKDGEELILNLGADR